MCAAWLTIWSIASSEKLIVISSTTGRSPAIAAPTPIPTIVFSEIGVSRTRFSPNSSSSPAVTLKAPWKTPMSSPMRKTRLVALHLLAQRLVERLAVAHSLPLALVLSLRCTPAERSSIEYQPWTWSPST